MDSPPALAVLIIGHGLIGQAVLARLRAAGTRAACVGRRPLDLPGYLAIDLATAAGRAELAAVLASLRPARVILVHGPSDVTWIDQNESAALAVHCGTARIVADSGLPAVLVSTDNVFPGSRGGCRPEDPVVPANGYGRVKARAERILLDAGPSMVLRVSLVYGESGPGLRASFGQRCLDAAAAGSPMSAPTDQIFTPVHVRDVAAVLTAICQSGSAGLAHLAGPAELSRHEFARLAYRLAGADPDLVRPCLRRDTEWACRPEFSSLACSDFSSLAGLADLAGPAGSASQASLAGSASQAKSAGSAGQAEPAGQAGWRPLTPEAGLREMLAARAARAARAAGAAGSLARSR